ncbi:MAG: hypothetical protein R3B12_05385 [Candidatus Saccharimonadales bacterium]
MPDAIRPTKRQLELLDFIGAFIAQHGYSPSYREIMVGCHYTSVATVALHVNNLIARGHLVKRGRSARSLEVTDAKVVAPQPSTDVTQSQAKWLVVLIDNRFTIAESQPSITQQQLDELYVLVGSLKVLGLQDAATSFMPRLKNLHEHLV